MQWQAAAHRYKCVQHRQILTVRFQIRLHIIQLCYLQPCYCQFDFITVVKTGAPAPCVICCNNSGRQHSSSVRLDQIRSHLSGGATTWGSQSQGPQSYSCQGPAGFQTQQRHQLAIEWHRFDATGPSGHRPNAASVWPHAAQQPAHRDGVLAQQGGGACWRPACNAQVKHADAREVQAVTAAAWVVGNDLRPRRGFEHRRCWTASKICHKRACLSKCLCFARVPGRQQHSRQPRLLEAAQQQQSRQPHQVPQQLLTHRRRCRVRVADRRRRHSTLHRTARSRRMQHRVAAPPGCMRRCPPTALHVTTSCAFTGWAPLETVA